MISVKKFWALSGIIFTVPFLLVAEVSIDPIKSPSMVPIIEFYPEELKAVVVEEVRDISFGISWEPDNSTYEDPKRGRDFRISILSDNPEILKVVNSSQDCLRTSEEPTNFTFSVKGMFLGYTKVRISISGPCDGDVILERKNGKTEAELKVGVIRGPSILVEIVTGVMAAFVALNFVNMGVELDLHTIGKILKKPIGPSIGFVCQFLFMPLAAYGLGWLLLDDISLRLGLFVLGCSPGGSMSNFWTLLFGGDLNLSITMTFISTIAALAMMPLWIFTLGAGLFHDQQATIPYINLAGSLLLLTLPMGIGLLIRQKSERLSRLSRRIIKPFTLICVALGVGTALYANRYIFSLFSWQVVLAGLGVAWGGYSFGALMAWIFRLGRPQIVAVSIETAFQNPAVAFVLLILSMPQPDADLSAVPVIAQLMLTGLPMWALLILTRGYRKMRAYCCGEEGGKEETAAGPVPEIETVQKAYMQVDTSSADDDHRHHDDDDKVWIEDNWSKPKAKIVKFKMNDAPSWGVKTSCLQDLD